MTRFENLSVIITYYCNRTDLSVLLANLQFQTMLPGNIIVIDNSPDGHALEYVTRYQINTPIYYIKQAGTINQSWNAGILEAKNNDCLILNDDVILPSNYIELCHKYRHRGMIICPDGPGFPPTFTVRNCFQVKPPDRAYKKYGKAQIKHPYLPIIPGWCFFLPRETIKQVGFFDEQFQIWYGDTDYDRRINYGFKRPQVIILRGVVVQHYGTASYSKIDKTVFNHTNYQDQIRFETKYSLKHQDLGWDKYA